MVIEAGVNHIDVAPTYGDAEERLGPWLYKGDVVRSTEDVRFV